MGDEPKYTELVLVRHGQAVLNVDREPYDGVCRGLTEKGRAQVELLARRLAGEARSGSAFAALYHSPLLRAGQTADAIAGALGIPALAHEGLRNPDHGSPALDYWNPALNTLGTIAPLAPDRPPGPGAEPWAGFLQRIDETLRELLARHQHARILVVAHAETAAAALHAFARLPFRIASTVYAESDNTALTIWRHHRLNLPGADPGGQFILQKANDTSHLEVGR